MAITTNLKIVIDREEIKVFSQCVIKQTLKTHHEFSILIPIAFSDLEKELEKAQGYIGGEISIHGEAASAICSAPLEFKGIVTNIQLHRSQEMVGGILVNGYSSTIAMEGTPNINSFNDKTLGNIVSEISSKYTAYREIKPETKIKDDTSMPYTVQYGESDYGFLSRMAEKKGQWFFYNGTQLFFGQPNGKNIEMVYGKNLLSFDIDYKLKPLNFEYIGYDPTATKTERVGSKQVGYQPKGESKKIFDASFELYNNKTSLLYANPIVEGSSQTHLVDRMKWQIASRASDLITARGESDETGLRIGDIITIMEKKFSTTGRDFDSSKEQNFGSFLLTGVTHYFDEIGSYYNSFEGIPDTSERPPYGNVHKVPLAEPQPAIVKNNNDPKGLGRIKVALVWQKDQGKETPWIRMSNPHAGSGKGVFFLPEKDEEVLVGFENGNAEKPYVIGSMYNSKAKTNFANAGNDKKVIQTRSGTQIVFDDAKNSITISDPSGNTVTLNGDKTISISAPDKIDIDSKEINITASEKVNINGTNEVNIDSKVVTTTGTTSVNVNSDALIKEEAPKIEGKATASMKLEAPNVDMNGSVMTNIKGTILNLN